jgi:NADPH:quinone reductase-like Zn-dependent oxidoreductase
VLHANPTVHHGSWAELIAVPEHTVAAKPPNVDVTEMGAAPLSAITALASFDALEPDPGKTVLVVGATGGVGSIFVQLAANAGARIIARRYPRTRTTSVGLACMTCSTAAPTFSAAVRERQAEGVDAVLDLVSQAPDVSVLREGGRLAYRSGPPVRRKAASTSWRCRRPRTSSASRGCSTPARFASPIQRASSWSRPARHSGHCPPRIPRAS